MKKIITLVVLIGVAGLVASPFVIGSKIQSAAEEQAQIADQQLKNLAKTNPYFQDAGFTVKSYEKSFLNGKAHSSLSLTTILPGDAGEPLVIEIPMISEITHGPYLSGSGFGVAKIVTRPDASKMKLPEGITADTVTIEDVISFSGQVNETMTVLPIKHEDGKGTTIDFGGAKANIQTSTRNRLTFKGDIAVEDITFSNSQNDKTFILQPINIALEGKGDNANSSGEYQLETGGIKGEGSRGVSLAAEKISLLGTYKPAENIDMSLGEQNMSVTNIVINSPEVLPGPIKLPEFTFKSVIDQSDKETINLSAHYDVTLDPSVMLVLQLPVDIKTASVEMEMKAIPVSLLKAYTEMTQQLSMSENPEADLAALQEQMPDFLQTAIDHSASAFVDVKADTGEGGLDVEVDLKLTSANTSSKEAIIEVLAAVAENPAALLRIVDGKGHLRLDKSVTDKAQLTPMIQMVAADFVTLEGDVFKSELLIKDGQVLVNNQPLPF